ncbi:MAG: hypothetical protein MK289_04210 [Trichodesmium sp. ALOHA_ZT_67]|nr:hypothetical protein [Trichodesmium sp. ALOHA_ZT_67]
MSSSVLLLQIHTEVYQKLVYLNILELWGFQAKKWLERLSVKVYSVIDA